jgi:hypothetical protein
MEGTVVWEDEQNIPDALASSEDFGWDTTDDDVAHDGYNELRSAFGIPLLFILVHRTDDGISFRKVTADQESGDITWSDLDETTDPKASEVAEALVEDALTV